MASSKDTQPVDDPIYLASIYRLSGVNFWESAKTLATGLELRSNGQPAKLDAIPFYFLASHATELLLKSALLKRGFTDAELRGRQFGHNLNGLLAALQAKGVTVTPDTVGLITGLHTQHATHALRYTALVDDGKPTYMPPPQLVLDMLTELLMLTAISTQGV